MKLNYLVKALLSLVLCVSTVAIYAAENVDQSTNEEVKKSSKAPTESAMKAVQNATGSSNEPKKIQNATINLQTTVTGNQEQPKVLYILPWQSPQTGDVDFETLESQQKAVFEHVERDELRRSLDSAPE